MNTSIKTFFAANKTAIMIGCATLVIAAKGLSFMGQQRQNENMNMPNQQMQQPMNGQMQGNMNRAGNPYQQQMPQQMGNNQNGNFWGNMFSDDEQGYGDNNYGGYSNNAYGGGYSNNSYGGYTGGGYTGNSYSAGSNSGVDYTSGWYATQQANDRMAEKFDDYITDQGRYTDENGNDYKMSSGYDYNYVNTTTGQSVQSNDAGYDPNVGSSYSYSSLTPSDYSSSSYSTTTPEE